MKGDYETMRGLFLRNFCILALLWLVGCRAGTSAPDESEEQLVVFGAASLRDAFEELGAEFKRQHPGLELTFNFAGTQELRTQIQHGAQADVFASANQKHMTELERSGEVKAPVLFARNEPVIVVSPFGLAATGHSCQRLVCGSTLFRVRLRVVAILLKTWKV